MKVTFSHCVSRCCREPAGKVTGASLNRTKLDSESSTWTSGQHETGGDHSVQPLALSSFAVPPKMDLICILMRKYHCSFRNIIRLICGGERGYLRCLHGPFCPKAEHSFVIKVIKIMLLQSFICRNSCSGVGFTAGATHTAQNARCQRYINLNDGSLWAPLVIVLSHLQTTVCHLLVNYLNGAA